MPGFGRHGFQVVQHPSARGHAAGRDDHGGVAQLRQAHRLLRCLRHPHALQQVARLAVLDAHQRTVAPVQLGGLRGHGAVQEHRQVTWNLSRRFQAMQHQQQRLCPAHRKAGDQDRTAARHGLADRGGQPGRRILHRVPAVAVSRFHQQHVRTRDLLWRRHQQIVLAPHIAGEHQPLLAVCQADRAGAQQVADGAQAQFHLAQAQALAGLQGLDACDGPQRVGAGVQGQGFLVPGVAVAVGTPGVLFLQVGAVQQQHLGQIARGRRGDHAAVEA